MEKRLIQSSQGSAVTALEKGSAQLFSCVLTLHIFPKSHYNFPRLSQGLETPTPIVLLALGTAESGQGGEPLPLIKTVQKPEQLQH